MASRARPSEAEPAASIGPAVRDGLPAGHGRQGGAPRALQERRPEAEALREVLHGDGRQGGLQRGAQRRPAVGGGEGARAGGVRPRLPLLQDARLLLRLAQLLPVY